MRTWRNVARFGGGHVLRDSFGKYLLSQGAVTDVLLADARMARGDADVPLSDVLVRLGVIAQSRLQQLRKRLDQQAAGQHANPRNTPQIPPPAQAWTQDLV